ncbi:MAG TPA: nucleoside-triphosphatase [Chitinophagaceae bacterium]|nr:nucleoside-triphosphatase [Chitinophagaceae bacterium]
MSNKQIYYRLIALWVLCEAMLGGVIHGFKIPVSGLVVGSCAIICICLIAYYVPQKGAILKATLVVAIFKMMLSPQAPPPAYIAVFFQGAMGELLFWNRKTFTLSCILLAVLGLLESGLQRILVLTIIYGNDLWTVINNFINGLTKQKTTTNYSLWIGGIYVAIHFMTGIFIGWWASLLPGRISQWEKEGIYKIRQEMTAAVLPFKKKKRKLKRGLFVIWLLLIALYVQSYFNIGTALLPSHISLKIFLRSVIIVFAWIFIIGPLLSQLLHGWLRKKQSGSREHIRQVVELLPATQALASQSWEHTSAKKGWRRLIDFSKTVLVNSLSPHAREAYILTAPVQSGKTTSLINWTEKNEAYGILTPVIEGKRVFLDINTKEQWPMESALGEKEILNVGRFNFSKQGFEKATATISKAINKDGWLVIDEIGPLELKAKGFHDVLNDVLRTRRERIILVVREGMAQQVMDHFQIEAKLIGSIDNI